MSRCAAVTAIDSLAFEDDPDFKQAIVDFRELVVTVRRKSAGVFTLPIGSTQREAAEQDVRDELRGIATRCERIGVSLARLMLAINDDLDRRARRGRPAPEFETKRTLIKRLTDAEAAEVQAHRDLTEVQARIRDTTAARVAAQAAAEAANIGDRPWWSSWK